MIPQMYAASERAALQEFLALQRDALISRLFGVSETEARSTPTASSLSLLAIVKHAAVWEHRWFGVVVAGHRSRDGWPEVDVQDDNGFRLDDADTVASVIADYRAQIAASESILAAVDLDAPCAVEWLAPNARWVAVHLIEETARHAGHADIIRETIDRAPSA